MFEESLVESTGLLRPKNHRPLVLSITVQAAVAAVLISIPVVHPEVLPLRVRALSLVAPIPKPTPPPQPQPVRVHIADAGAFDAPSAPAPAGPRIARFHEPTTGADLPPSSGTIDIGGSGSEGTGLPSAIRGNGTPSEARVVIAAAGPKTRTRISSGVSAGLLLEPIRPAYPAIAKMARIEGTVVVQAVISKRGMIESAHVMTGPPMLQGAALEAIEKAHYKPYLLNGEPTEVDTMFSVVFKLSGS